MAYVMAAVPQASVAVAATGLGDVPHMIAYLSELFTLKPGGLIYTGTPAGVGPSQRGDVMCGGMTRLAK
jgi:2-keto-4-pentenoate hydratase/2-oxohepta-3-ene-1,7-dioic acid hydratase in catechol pathway